MGHALQIVLLSRGDSSYATLLEDKALLYQKKSGLEVAFLLIHELAELPTILDDSPQRVLLVEGLDWDKRTLLQLKPEYPNLSLVLVCIKSLCFEMATFNELLKPQGIWHVEDLKPNCFSLFLAQTLEHPPCFSPKVASLFQNTHLAVNDFDKKLLACLDQGIHNKDLPKHLSGSMSTIERSKRKLKVLFDVEELTDCALVNKAREQGFLR